MLSLFTLHAKEKSQGVHPSPLKIGYVNLNRVLGLLPEIKTVGSELGSFVKQLDKQLKEKVADYDQKEQTFRKGRASMVEAVRSQKELELQQLQRSIEQLELESQEKLTSKHASLLAPIYEKIKNAIVQVAKENGYTHVLNADVEGMSVLLYVDEEHNLSNRILKKLGISPEKIENTKE